ncbi:unnamed protein product [Ectocarpus sp. CCAP 1310/34]|nr:unnamed protein product [Ectocarpus sp. CCAP 1310/34]
MPDAARASSTSRLSPLLLSRSISTWASLTTVSRAKGL